MTLTVSSFRTRKETSGRHLGNVHIKVEDYIRDDQGKAVAVHGVNLKNGDDVTVRLADADRFAKLYLNPREDIELRKKTAEQQITKRTTMREIGAARGNKAVPVGGVLSISSVRLDESDGNLYGRWPNAVVTDPDKELPLMATFEVRKTLSKTSEGKEYTTAFIQAYFPQQAVASKNADISTLNKMLSGTLFDTGAEMRTNIAVTVLLDNETATFAFRPKAIVDENNSYKTAKGVEAALSGEIKRMPEAVAAAAVAAVAGVPFEDLKIKLDQASSNKMDDIRLLYEGVRNGEIATTFTPGATLQPSRFTVDALLGRKIENDGEIKTVKTPEQELIDRGFVNGALGVRYISNETGEIVQPVVKAMFTDEKLPLKSSDHFVRLDLNSVGYDAFMSTQEIAEDNTPRLGRIQPEENARSQAGPTSNHEATQGIDDVEDHHEYDDDNDIVYHDNSPSF